MPGEIATGFATAGLSTVSKAGSAARLASNVLQVFDVTGNAVVTTQGVASAAQNGLTFQNSVQIIGGGVGVGVSARPAAAAASELASDAARIRVSIDPGALTQLNSGAPLNAVKVGLAPKTTGAHSRRLAEDLIAKGYPRPPGYQAGHIIPTNAFVSRSAAVRKAISTAQTKFDRYLGDDLRDAAINGFWAEAGHAGTHTDKFFLELGRAFRSVNSRASAERAMESVWRRIEAGEFQ